MIGSGGKLTDRFLASASLKRTFAYLKTDGYGYTQPDHGNDGKEPIFHDGQQEGFLNRLKFTGIQFVGFVPPLQPPRSSRRCSELSGREGTSEVAPASARCSSRRYARDPQGDDRICAQ